MHTSPAGGGQHISDVNFCHQLLHMLSTRWGVQQQEVLVDLVKTQCYINRPVTGYATALYPSSPKPARIALIPSCFLQPLGTCDWTH